MPTPMLTPCACLGPRNGEPYCACTMERAGLPRSAAHKAAISVATANLQRLFDQTPERTDTPYEKDSK